MLHVKKKSLWLYIDIIEEPDWLEILLVMITKFLIDNVILLYTIIK